MEYEKEGEIRVQDEEPNTDVRIEHLINETENALRNTRSFFDHLRSSEGSARELVDLMKQRFEKELATLHRKSETEVRS